MKAGKYDKTKERVDTMVAISKPADRAFVLDSSKANDFFTKKAHTSSEVLKRFENRKNRSTAIVKADEK